MSKPSVERYEQILALDPASTVFVELARALIERQDHARAVEVCRQGLTYHTSSVTGRVLWGKALIYLGRPAEAMEQFDQAVELDKENPHAYNLICEVLLQKGLYRSAVPLLKKAVALQPNNGRVRQWLEQTQQALAGGPPLILEPLPEEPAAELPPVAAAPPPRDEAGEVTYPDAPAQAEGEVKVPAPEKAASRRKELLEDISLPSAGEPVPVPALEPGAVPQGASGSRRVLLEEIPDIAPAPERSGGRAPSVEVPKVELSPSAAQAIAEEYERELRAKLAQAKAQKKVLQVHGAKLAVGAVVLVAVLVGVGAFLKTRLANQGRDLQDTLAEAKKGIAQDTQRSYRAALASLAAAVQMDSDSEEAWALTAYTHALLFAEHGGQKDDQAKALPILDRPGVQAAFPALVLVARYHLADAAAKEQARAGVFASNLDSTDLHELAGRLLLAKKDTKQAVERFKQALALGPGNVRALVALGNYFREAGDCEQALAMYVTAAGSLSPEHPERVVGAAECRLLQEAELDEALKEVESVPADVELAPDLLARKELVHGRLLAAAGQYKLALQKLEEGARRFHNRAYEFNLALGEASRAAGKGEAAQQAFEAALKLRPSEEAQEGLGRVLLDRDREKELLARLVPEGEVRKVYLVRGIAYARLGDWKHARAELARTQVGGKFPGEAVVYLALADAAEGNVDRAQEVLEKALAASKKSRSDVQVALGQLHLQRGAKDKARLHFEGAMKDPQDYEGGCALGRLLLAEGQAEAAVAPLVQSTSRNGLHGEARQALVQAYLKLGRTEDALEHATAWHQGDAASALAAKYAALALYRSAKAKEAEAVISQAVQLNATDPEVYRVQAQILFARGDVQEAFSALGRANKLDPKDALTFCEIGHAFLRQANSTHALKAFEAARRENARSLCGRIGTALARLPGAARSVAQELSELAGGPLDVADRALVQSGLARAALSGGQLTQARQAAEEAVRLAPYSGYAHWVLGVVAMQQQDEAKARELLFKAEELEPAQADVHLALGDLLVRSNEGLRRAIQEYELYLKTGGSPEEQARVKRLLPNLKKKLASR